MQTQVIKYAAYNMLIYLKFYFGREKFVCCQLPQSRPHHESPLVSVFESDEESGHLLISASSVEESKGPKLKSVFDGMGSGRQSKTAHADGIVDDVVGMVVLVVVVNVVDVFVVVVVVGAALDINFELNSSLTRVSMVTTTAIGLFATVLVKSLEPLTSQFAAMDLLKTKAFVIIETASKSIRVDAK